MAEVQLRHRRAAEAWWEAKPITILKAEDGSVMHRMRTQDYAQALADQEAELAEWLARRGNGKRGELSNAAAKVRSGESRKP